MVVARLQPASPRDNRPLLNRKDSRATSSVSTRTANTPSSTVVPAWRIARMSSVVTRLRFPHPKLAWRCGHESSYTAAPPFRQTQASGDPRIQVTGPGQVPRHAGGNGAPDAPSLETPPPGPTPPAQPRPAA